MIARGVRGLESGPLDLPSHTALPPPLPTNGSLSLALSLGAGLLVETTLPQLGVETGTLDLALEPAQCPLEALIVMYDDFQSDHAPSLVN